MPTKPYTVILLRPDYVADEFGKDTFSAWVEAEGIVEAVAEARAQALVADEWAVDVDSGEDYHCLAIICGHHTIYNEPANQ